MIDLFYMGGPLFMGILTLILATVLAIAVYNLISIKREQPGRVPVTLVKEVGIFGLVIGILGQFTALYEAFAIIEQAGAVSPAVLMGGLKISSITTLYGLTVCAVGYAFYFGLQIFKEKSAIGES